MKKGENNMDQWISVNEKLPNKDGSDLVHSSLTGKVFTEHFWTGTGTWSGSAKPYISHWMPLPGPPKEEM